MIFVLFIGCILFVSSCGRKNKSIFVFAMQTQQEGHNKFLYPYIRSASAYFKNGAANICWEHVQHNFLKGYAIYSVSPLGIVAKKPLILLPRQINYYVDIHGKQTSCYVIKPIYVERKETFEGLASKIVFCNTV